MRLEITSIWQTEEHPREGLTVVDEREHVLFYLIDILYRVVPLFYEEIEAALANAYRRAGRDQLDVPSILHFGSWVGGDMDGNAGCARQDHSRNPASPSAGDRVDATSPSAGSSPRP